MILVQLLGQSRVFYSMANDGLLPPIVNRLHPKFKTPWITQILLGVLVAIPAGFLSVREAASLVSIGTLLAFVIVCAAVLLLRKREPTLHRPFKTPLVWFTAPAGIAFCLYLMYFLPLRTWIRLLVWLAIGLVIYFGYGKSHSKLAKAGE